MTARAATCARKTLLTVMGAEKLTAVMIHLTKMKTGSAGHAWSSKKKLKKLQKVLQFNANAVALSKREARPSMKKLINTKTGLLSKTQFLQFDFKKIVKKNLLLNAKEQK